MYAATLLLAWLGAIASAGPWVDAGETSGAGTQGPELGAPGIGLPGTSGPVGVVGGEPALEGAWPDAAALYSGLGVGCTGVLITPDTVLTAGHCGWNVSDVVVGTVDFASGGERIAVVETIVHEDYLSTYDVALLRLAQPAQTPPRKLALDCLALDYVVDGAPVAIVGFGATDLWASEYGTVLYEAWTTAGDAACESVGAGCNPDVMPDGELVAGGDGVDSCNGDSGGPLYVATPQGDYLAGITSRAALPTTTPCGDGGIYVRVDAVADWIEEVLGEPLERPACEGMNRAPHAEVDAIQVAPGGTAATAIRVDDPNADDDHHFTLVAEPERGWASVSDDGELVYVAPFEGDAQELVLVQVVDDGDPPLSVEVEVPIHVVAVARSSAGGCATAPPAPWLAVLAAALLGRRRRRC